MASYVLIKGAGYDSGGRRLDARESAMKLLDARMWPLWEGSRNRKSVKSGDEIVVYLSGAGNQAVIAQATIEKVGPWDRSVAARYPLTLDGIPSVVMHLANVCVFGSPKSVVDRLASLSFIKPGSKKWGVSFMGGVRAVSMQDFQVLVA